MTLRDKFADQKQREAEDNSFQSVRKYGLMRFADEAHSRFMEELGVEPTRETRNAYLLQVDYIIDNYGFTAPEAIESVVNHERMRSTKALHELGPAYLQETSSIKDVSPELYAAAMASSAVKPGLDLERQTALIGEDALSMITTTELFYEEHGRLFQKPYTSAETKALHLTETAEQLEQVRNQAELQLKENGAIAHSTANFGISLVTHLAGLQLRPNRSELENQMVENARVINKALNEQPVAKENVMFAFPYQEPPEGPDLPPPPSDDDPPTNG